MRVCACMCVCVCVHVCVCVCVCVHLCLVEGRLGKVVCGYIRSTSNNTLSRGDEGEHLPNKQQQAQFASALLSGGSRCWFRT